MEESAFTDEVGTIWASINPRVRKVGKTRVIDALTNKLASLEATLVQNYERPSDRSKM